MGDNEDGLRLKSGLVVGLRPKQRTGEQLLALLAVVPDALRNVPRLADVNYVTLGAYEQIHPRDLAVERSLRWDFDEVGLCGKLIQEGPGPRGTC